MVQEYPLFEGQGIAYLASTLPLVGILPFLCWDPDVKYSLMLLQRWQNLCLPTQLSKGGNSRLDIVHIGLHLESFSGGGGIEHVHGIDGDSPQSFLKPY